MSDWLDIAGRVYVVTGGSSGIGKAIVTELLSDGAYVANLMTNPSRHGHVIPLPQRRPHRCLRRPGPATGTPAAGARLRGGAGGPAARGTAAACGTGA